MTSSSRRPRFRSTPVGPATALLAGTPAVAIPNIATAEGVDPVP